MSARIYQYLLVLALGVGLFIGIEAALRFLAPEPESETDLEAPPAAPNFAYDLDRVYGQGLKANAEGVEFRSKKNGGQTIRWRTNADGFRGEALRTDADLRIMVYGDSNIQASFSELENTFPAKLAHYLQPKLRATVEVVNAGTVGFGPDQSYLKFAEEVDRYRPDIVIFHVFADNDFGDLVRNQLFVLDASGHLQRAERAEAAQVPHEATARPPRIKHKLANLRVARAARNAGQSLLGTRTKSEGGRDWLKYFHDQDRLAHAWYTTGAGRGAVVLYDHYDIDVATAPDSPSARTKRALMEAVLGQASELARSKNVDFVVLIQPSAIDLTHNYWVSYEDLAGYPGYRTDNLTGAVERICERLNLPYVNLFDAFRGSKPEELFFFRGDNHWNDAGQDLAARVTAASLAERIADR